MARLSKTKSAEKKREICRSKRPKIAGVYLREVTETSEVYNITVRVDGKNKSKRLTIPTTMSNPAFRDAIERVQKELKPVSMDGRLEFGDIVEEYIANRRLRDRTAQNLRLYVKGYGWDDIKNRELAIALRDGNLKTSTKRIRIKAIRSIFRYIRVEKSIEVADPTSGMKTPDGEPRSRIPTQDELAMLLHKTDCERYAPDSLYVRLLLDTGARCSTLEKLRPCDLDADNRLSLYNAKMSRKYKYPQLIEDKDTLMYWAKTCSGKGRTDYIFDHTFRRRLQGRMLRWFGRDAENQTLSPHSLRHLKATTLARKGCPLKLASLLLDASPAVLLRTYQNLKQEDIDSASIQYKVDRPEASLDEQR